MKEKAKAGELKIVSSAVPEKKKRRWDQTQVPVVGNENDNKTESNLNLSPLVMGKCHNKKGENIIRTLYKII